MFFPWYSLLSGLFFLVFLLVFVMIVLTLIRAAGQWRSNNRSPRLTVDARVVSRRTDVRHHQQAIAGDHTGAHGYHTYASTDYYVTFEVESGDRMEFSVSGQEYGMLTEGDRGRLSFQGTCYLGFLRS